MKVFLIAAITVNGFIGRRHDELANWTSKADKKLFVELTKRAGVIVMGGTTYRTIGRPLAGRRNIVYSRTPIDQEGVETTTETPQDLVARLEAEGFSEIAICGGATIYDMFIQAGVVDELYLTVEPRLFGSGVPIFGNIPETKLRLIEHRPLNENVVMLHYKIAR